MPVSFGWTLTVTPDPAAATGTGATPHTAVRLTVDGDIDLTYGKATLVGGGEAIGGRLRQRMERVRGEWFLNRERGLAWFDDIFVKGPLLLAQQGMIVREAAMTPGITAVERTTLDLAADRQLVVDLVATTKPAGTLTLKTLMGG